MNPLLTTGFADEVLMRATPDGMAFWQGTGPFGTACGDCANWCRKPTLERGSYRRDAEGRLMSRRCRLYSRMAQGRESHYGIPAQTPSCRYFELAESPPPLLGRKAK